MSGKVDPEEIKKIVERNVANARLRSAGLRSEGAISDRSGTADIDGGSESIVNRADSAVSVRHIETLGRGTICQIDRFTIDGRDFAVKSLSPELAKDITIDVGIQNLVYTPLPPQFQEFLKEFIESFRESFGQDIIPPTDDLQQYQNEATVGETCSQIYHWLKDNGHYSDTEEPVLTEAMFVSILPRFLIWLAMDHMDKEMVTADQPTVQRVAGVPFDHFFVRNLGFRTSPTDPLLLRVKWQLSAYRKFIASQEEQLDHPLHPSQSF